MDDGDVVLGLSVPHGYAAADLTSPARAAAAGGLVDREIPGPVTELRIHGVAGSTAATMLEHPTTIQVGGDRISGFHRRWTPGGGATGLSVPRKLECYSWGGLTQRRLASASWILLAPFMLYNVAHYMLPAREKGRFSHYVAAMVLRWLALGATLQIVAGATGVLVDVLALRADPGRLGGLGAWSAADRATWALGLVALAIGLLWAISVRTARNYEKRISSLAPVPEESNWPLRDPHFWRGKELVDRQRGLHTTAALAMVVLLVPVRSGTPAAVAWWVAAGLLAFAVVLIATPAVHRRTVVRDDPVNRLSKIAAGLTGVGWRWLVLAIAGGDLVAAAYLARSEGTWSGRDGLTAELTMFWSSLTYVQIGLFVLLVMFVMTLRPWSVSVSDKPYLRGLAGPVIALLGALLGGMLSAVVTIGIAWPFGVPVAGDRPAGIVAPLYMFGSAPFGMLVGALLAGLWLGWRFYRNWKRSLTATDGPAPIDREYELTDGTDPTVRRRRRQIARAWAVGALADDVGPVIAGTAVGGMAAVVLAAITTDPDGFVARVVEFSTPTALALSGLLVGLLRSAYSDPNRRRVIGAVWDVGTFWPRAAHPFAPPCYAERAVPEVVDRIRLLTGTVDPSGISGVISTAARQTVPAGQRVPADQRIEPGLVLLTGYSQGSIIAPAAVAQLPPETRARLGLLTLACPARRLYGRAFPAYFGPQRLDELATVLSGPYPADCIARLDGPDPAEPVGPSGWRNPADLAPLLVGAGPARLLRWRNVARRSDYIGSYIWRRPEPGGGRRDLCSPDPAALVPDRHPAPPPTHRHSHWWPDPAAGQVADELAAGLPGACQPAMDQADPAEPVDPADPARMTRLTERAKQTVRARDDVPGAGLAPR